MEAYNTHWMTRDQAYIVKSTGHGRVEQQADVVYFMFLGSNGYITLWI
jgi:hypothetical protein